MEIKIDKDIGYRVLTKNEDNTPKQVLRCFVKEGKYGKFISLEKHWVQNISGDDIDTKWGRWSVNIPYDKKEALNLITHMKELVEQVVQEEFGE